ncbi:MAG: hypothetical protein JST85_19715 [Acidobacteria bacterium]|nr:hypothetical protein [Acidobacteriota bacterium]
MSNSYASDFGGYLIEKRLFSLVCWVNFTAAFPLGWENSANYGCVDTVRPGWSGF